MTCRILLAALLFSLQMNVKAQCFSDYVFPSEGENIKYLRIQSIETLSAVL